MAFNFVQDFKTQIYEILAANPNITSKIDKIYLSVMQDAKYPFLLINVGEIVDHSKYDHGIYNIEFEICLFVRDKVQGVLPNLLDEITKIIVSTKFKFAHHVIAGLKSSGVKFEQATDLITTKLSVNYKALIKEVII